MRVLGVVSLLRVRLPIAKGAVLGGQDAPGPVAGPRGRTSALVRRNLQKLCILKVAAGLSQSLPYLNQNKQQDEQHVPSILTSSCWVDLGHC